MRETTHPITRVEKTSLRPTKRTAKHEHGKLLELGFPTSTHRPPIRASNSLSTRTQRKSRPNLVDFVDDAGAVTAEYALIITAAVAFAGLLIVILRSDEVRGALLSIVQNALTSAG